jgi:hypothetical protein
MSGEKGTLDRIFLEFPAEMGGSDNEKPKEKDLNKEPNDNDVFSVLKVVQASAALNAPA